MKDLIKIIIALASIFISYYIGYYIAKEKYIEQFNEEHVKLRNAQSNIKDFKDSIKLINKKITQDTLGTKQKIDTNNKFK